MARPEEDLLKLEEKFVRLRVTNMAEVDVGRFDFDFDNTYAAFVFNSGGQIYTRYGGRTDADAEAFVNIPGFQRALEKGLAMHQAWKGGVLKLPPPGESKPARSYALIDNFAEGGRCIHCHDVASASAQGLMASPDIDKAGAIGLYPDPWMLGLVLDPKDGNLLADTEVTALEAGLEKGARILSLGDFPVRTFTDIQYGLHHLPPKAERVTLGLEGGEEIDLPLPEGWRGSNISRRQIARWLSPKPPFQLTPLSHAERKELGLPEYGLSGRVTSQVGEGAGALQQGDIVVAIAGVKESPLTADPSIYLGISGEPREPVQVSYLRDGESATTEIVPIAVDIQRLRGGRGRRG